MPISRQFLSWDQPILQSAADWLIENAALSPEKLGGLPLVDLSQTVVVVPGGLAGRRLLEILVAQTESDGKSLVPPQVLTVGQLPEQLYEAKLPFASELTQQFAWGETLREFSPEALRPLIPYPPENGDHGTWRDYGDAIRRVYRELISNSLDFATVSQAADSLEGFTEQQRWAVLAQLQQAYLRRLDGLEIWDKQSARLYAIQHNLCSFDRHLVLLGTVDLNRATRQMLDQVADKGGKISALIGAPLAYAEYFDDHGCLLSEKWAEAPIDLDWHQVALVDGPTQQADAVAGYISQLAKEFSAKQIVLGLPDEGLLGEVQRILGLHGLNARFGPGKGVVDTLPFRLLETLVEVAHNRAYHALAASLRHPDVFDTVHLATPGIEKLDAWFNARLAQQLDRSLSEGDLQPSIERLTQCLDILEVAPLPLAQWSDKVRQLLLHVYGQRVLDLDSDDNETLARPLEAINQAVAQWEEIPEPLSHACTATEMLRVLRSQLTAAQIPAPLDPDAIEAVGWLELPLIDAPACIVTSFCDGLVPSSNTADLFLPNSLRKLLGLEDDSLRYARDAYQVQVIHHTRQAAYWIVPKRNADGDPLAPSRLLFAGAQDDLPQRVQRFFGPPQTPENGARCSTGEIRDHRQRLPIPLPELSDACDPDRWNRVSATLINNYLKCPYRFYLRYIASLRGQDDQAQELDGGAFGSLAHDALQAFGTSEVKDSDDEKVLFEFLSSTLSDLALSRYGSRPQASLKIQFEQLRLRLRAFAQAQAEHRQQGWTIYRCEAEVGEPFPTLSVDGSPVELAGRIDRIDRHEDTGQWAVWDYKTGDRVADPEKGHCKGKNENRTWHNVQLPFYRHLVKGVGIRGPVSLGFITLPKLGEEVRFRPANWQEEDLDEADETIATVIRALRRGEFLPPNTKLDYTDEYSRICQDSVLGKWEFPS